MIIYQEKRELKQIIKERENEKKVYDQHCI
jgi:hypothetical protein